VKPFLTKTFARAQLESKKKLEPKVGDLEKLSNFYFLRLSYCYVISKVILKMEKNREHLQ
jgi:hypothetical protein